MYAKLATHKNFVGQKKLKKGFFKREKIGVSFLAATKMDTTEEIIVMILSRFIYQKYKFLNKFFLI